jgi:hypothetical protein
MSLSKARNTSDRNETINEVVDTRLLTAAVFGTLACTMPSQLVIDAEKNERARVC